MIFEQSYDHRAILWSLDNIMIIEILMIIGHY